MCQWGLVYAYVSGVLKVCQSTCSGRRKPIVVDQEYAELRLRRPALVEVL